MIGSAAAYLAGLRDEAVADVDLLVTVSDAERLLSRLGASAQPPEPSDLFRSAVFGRVEATPVAIEVMAHLRLGALAWDYLTPRDRVPVTISSGTLFIPRRGRTDPHPAPVRP